MTAIAVRENIFGCSGRRQEARHLHARMAITFGFDQERKLLLTKAEGAMTYEEIYHHLIEERKAMGLSYPEIIDARTVTPAISSAEVRGLMWLLHSLGQTNVLGPTAIIVSTPVAFGLIRMGGLLCEDMCAIAPFWSLEEAEAWIAKGAPMDFSDRAQEKQLP